jgi:hypothetical protein
MWPSAYVPDGLFPSLTTLPRDPGSQQAAHASISWRFLQRIGAPVGLLGLVVDDMGQRGFDQLAGEWKTLPAQPRKLERKPCTVASTFMRRRSMSIAMLDRTTAPPAPRRIAPP